VSRMKPDQQDIYYLTGASRLIVEHSPQLEAFRDCEYEVLYLLDPVDELVVQSVREFDGRRLRSVLKGRPILGSDEERRSREHQLEEGAREFAPLLEAFQQVLGPDVRAVRLSPRLVDAPVCLACDELDEGPRLEQLLLRGKGGGPRQPRVLEVNPQHPVVKQLLSHSREHGTTPLIEQFARLLHGHALIAEGSELLDHATFARVLTAVMTDRLSLHSNTVEPA